jgi:hypothetical protein
VGSIANDIIRLYNLYDLSSRNVSLGSIEPLTETSTKNLLKGKEGPELKADNLAACVSRLSRKYGILNVTQPNGPPLSVAKIDLSLSDTLST